MLKAFRMAVGPVQPNEVTPTEAYVCQMWQEGEPSCMWRLKSAGDGKMYAECHAHNYMIYIVDRDDEATSGRSNDARQKLSP